MLFNGQVDKGRILQRKLAEVFYFMTSIRLYFVLACIMIAFFFLALFLFSNLVFALQRAGKYVFFD